MTDVEPTRRPRPASRRRDLLAGWRADALAGAIAAVSLAAHATGLLFFINPAIEVRAGDALAGTLLYAAIAWPVLSLALRVLARAARAPTLRLVPWVVTLVLALVSLAYWTHASDFAFYLDPAVNAQMLRTALVASGTALVAFYTALLHSLHRRPYGPRSAALLALAMALSLAVVAVRRGRAQERSRPPSPPPVVLERAVSPGHLVIVIAPASTLDVVLPAAEQGKLPFFAELIEQGSYARLRSLTPPRPLALSATLGTGKLPYRNGLLGERRYSLPGFDGATPFALLPLAPGFAFLRPPGASSRASTALDRRSRTVWEILAGLGLRAAAIGVPDALLGEGSLVETYRQEEFDPAPATPPQGRAARIAALRPDPRTVPRAVRDALASSGRSDLLDSALADRWRTEVARELLAEQPAFDLLVVELQGVAAASRATFSGFAAAELEGDRAGDARRAADALEAYYSDFDERLEALWSAIPRPRRLVVVSPYGMDALRGVPKLLAAASSRERVRGTIAGAPDGLLLLRGDGLRPGVALSDAELADVAPTLLYACGLPTARDFDGKVLVDAFERAFLERHPLVFVPSYENLTAR